MWKYDVYNYTEKSYLKFSIDNPFTGKMAEAMEKFLHYYEPDLIAPPAEKKRKLKKPVDRTCRFCNRRYPETTFRNDAHVLPHLLGNRYLIHDEECDQCNAVFKDYEDSLSKYFGIMRTADVIRGKKGVPAFESADGKLSMRLVKTENGVNYIDIVDANYGANKVDENSILLKSTKQTYIPLHAMKSLVKIGYCLLRPEELLDYSPTCTMIKETRFDDKLFNFAQVAKFTVPVILKSPFVVTYRKKKEHISEHLPTKVVCLHFGRYVYEYFLLNAEDKFLFKEGEQCSFLQIPPYFEGDQSKLIFEKIDLSSPNKKAGEQESIILTFDKRP